MTNQASQTLSPIAYEVLIVDDHPLYREALKGAVIGACPAGRFHEAEDVGGMFDVLSRHPHVDLLLLDLNLPGAHGFSALANLRGSYPQLPVIVVSAMDSLATVHQALAFGAQAFLSKSAHASAIRECIEAVLRGELVTPPGYSESVAVPDHAALDIAERVAQLTPQQFRVFSMLCSGRLNKQIAHELELTEATVKAHMTSVMRKLGAANRTHAVLLATRLGMNPEDVRPQPAEAD
jgi:DNA-binding NarL/FixJ family response regulator